ncbi:minor tail protein [Pseudomonas phage KP1]|uniref:Minor tail protein n=1 Tax=Pseudomonas phage KP1 TaxID=2562463 RepID=A0A6G5QAF8_9CAUD|nr:tail terminator [Pseudomonas phage KP1]QBZ71726.1 minor tail protein [Pseudomonas phage KP1]
MIEFDEVDDEINTLFKTAWDLNSSAVAGYIPEVRWQGLETTELPDGSKFWCRVSKQTLEEEQATLSNCEGAPGKKKYTADGLIFVQLFCPKSNSRSFQLGQKLAKIARNAFRGKSTPGGVWFRNVRINELDPENLYHRFNVIAEFEYDELG